MLTRGAREFEIMNYARRKLAMCKSFICVLQAADITLIFFFFTLYYW